MEPRRFRRWSAAGAALATILLFPAPGLQAQQRSAVRCDALVGFNGTAREDRFAPVILSVENPGPRMKAEVTLRVTWGGTFRGASAGRALRQETILDAGETRRIPFVVPIPRGVRALQGNVSSQGVEVGSLEVELRPMTTAGRIVAAVSSELSFDSLSGLPGSPAAGSPGAGGPDAPDADPPDTGAPGADSGRTRRARRRGRPRTGGGGRYRRDPGGH